MHYAARARLGSRAAAIRWFFDPAGEVDEAGRSFLLAQLLGAPAAAMMGALCAIVVVCVALLRTGDAIFVAILALELGLIAIRVIDSRRRERQLRAQPDRVLIVDGSVLLSTLWCALQGVAAFIIMSGADPVLRVLSATLVMALIGPICARNYAAPRFAFLLILLCDLPFVAGALASHEPWLAVIAAITPPFLIGAMQIIGAFHRTTLLTLAAEARNLHLAHHDSLTGILNRQGMDAALALIRPNPDRKMALISIDLDGFKQVNDRYGHGAGDLLLAQVAQRIVGGLQGDHLFGRMGGDEFMVVMRDALPEDVGPAVERLIVAISHLPYDLGNGTVARVGASIGFACMPEDAASAVQLRLRADQALYEAKAAGKGLGLRYVEPSDDDAPSAPGAGSRTSPFFRFEPRQAGR